MTRRLALLSALLACSAWAKHKKVDVDLDGISATKETELIVRFKEPPAERHHRKVTQRGGKHRGNLDLVRSAAYTLSAAQIEDLANDPDVEFISPDRPVRASLDLTAGAINAAAAWNAGFEGSGIGVALIDSGVDKTDTYLRVGSTSGSYRVVYSQDFTGSGTTDDQFGHGSHVAGIIGNGRYHTAPSEYVRKIAGIAPTANLINLKVLNKDGVGSDSQVIAAIQRAVALKSTYNIRVINLSLGRPVTASYVNDPLCQAAEQAWKAGIVVVVAAGNYGRNNFAGNLGYGTIAAPGNDPYVITVGAMKANGTMSRGDDTIASYSSKGPTQIDNIVKPDILAPGNQVVSLYPFPGKPTAGQISEHTDQRFLLSQLDHHVRFRFLLQAERHQHGGSRRKRGGGAVDSEGPVADAGPGQGPPDEDCVQSAARAVDGLRSFVRRQLHQQVRPVHGRSRLSGYRRGDGELRQVNGPGAVSQSRAARGREGGGSVHRRQRAGRRQRDLGHEGDLGNQRHLGRERDLG